MGNARLDVKKVEIVAVGRKIMCGKNPLPTSPLKSGEGLRAE
jgi:hypothetical protein